MENSLLTTLDQVINSIKLLKERHAITDLKVKEYEEQIELLKVEVDIYKEELTNIKIATETKNVKIAREINTPIHLSSPDETKVNKNLPQSQPLSGSSSDNNEQLKIELDGFIEELDQCIKTIVTKK